jgi:hypothetical protein
MRFKLIIAILFALLCVPLVRADEWASGVQESLDEVNAWRAGQGLPAFEYDEGLTMAAAGCAHARAQALCFGHTSNDFAALPPGASARAAGCAAYPDSYGWLSCCMRDRHRYGGAAWMRGRDGKRYMHLFVSDTPSKLTVTTATKKADDKAPVKPMEAAPGCPGCASCASGNCGMSERRGRHRR